jgi:hypothetical protein
MMTPLSPGGAVKQFHWHLRDNSLPAGSVTLNCMNAAHNRPFGWIVDSLLLG